MTIPTPFAPDDLPDLGPLAGLFAVLGDACRMGILFALADGERNVTELRLDVCRPQPTVSHHLGILRNAGLVRCRRAGQMTCYALCPPSRAADGGLELHAGGHVVQVRWARAEPDEPAWLAAPG